MPSVKGLVSVWDGNQVLHTPSEQPHNVYGNSSISEFERHLAQEFVVLTNIGNTIETIHVHLDSLAKKEQLFYLLGLFPLG